MKKNLMKSLKVLSLCLVLSLFVGISVVSAQAPANNVAGPLNVGPMQQEKEGSLLITNGGNYTQTDGLLHRNVVVGYTAPSGGSAVQNIPASTSAVQSSYLQKNEKEGIFTKLAKFFGLNTEKALADVVTGDIGQTGGLGLQTPPTCGTATSNSYTTSNIPTSMLCQSGASHGSVESDGSTLWHWMCYWPSSPSNSTMCSAINTQSPKCGASNNGSFSVTPTTGLCDVASDLSGSVTGSGANAGYWKWKCARPNVSGTVSCSANKGTIVGTGTVSGGAVVTPTEIPTYRFTVNGRSNLNGYTKVEGDVDVAGAITSGGKNVCLQDGTNCAAGQTLPSSNLFGGTFTKRSDTNVGVNKNPFTNDYTCPANFTSYLMAEYSVVGAMANQNGYLIKDNSKPLIPANLIAHSSGALISSNYNIKLFGCLHI